MVHGIPSLPTRWSFALGVPGPSHELHLAAWRCSAVYTTPACQDKRPGPPCVTASMCLLSRDPVWATRPSGPYFDAYLRHFLLLTHISPFCSFETKLDGKKRKKRSR